MPQYLIVGMSRAGTTWLMKCLNRSEHVSAFGETIFWGRNYIAPKKGSGYTSEEVRQIRDLLSSKGMEGNCASSGLNVLSVSSYPSFISDFFESIAYPIRPGALFAKFCDKIAEIENKKLCVEKTPHHLIFVERILAEMPDARFIILLREPYGFVLSYKHQGDRKDPAVKRVFEKFYHPIAAALVWKKYMRKAMAVLDEYASQSLLIRFDDIEHRPRVVLDRVNCFLGVPSDGLKALPPENTSFPGARKELRNRDIK